MPLNPEVLFLLKLLISNCFLSEKNISAQTARCSFFKRYHTLFFIVFAVFSLASCSSVGKGSDVIDYSDALAVSYRIDYIKSLMDSGKLSEALVRINVLKQKTTAIPEAEILHNEILKMLEDLFYKAVKENRWGDALIYFRTLSSSGVKMGGWSETKIFSERSLYWKKNDNAPLLGLDKINVSKNYSSVMYPQSIEDMIKGTLTVCVDRGIRIEKGIGYADVVIGSGFFIDSKGYFITNYHVIKSEVDPEYNGNSKLYIKSPYNQNVKISAKVIGWDPLFDLALVKTEITPEVIFGLGSSRKLNIGSKIYAIGSPAGLEKTITSGIVSAKSRRLFSMVDVLQIDAAINHGNSGGPIVDDTGYVQAVVFAGLEANEGLNFAVPVELLKIVLPDLYLGGKIKHSWLAGYGKSFSSLIENKIQEGVEVSYILPDGALHMSEVKEGTIITEVNGISIKRVEELQALLLDISPGTVIKIHGYEPDKEKNNYLEIERLVLCGERPLLPGKTVFEKDNDSRAMLPIFGFNLKNAGRNRSFRVVDIMPGSFADEAGFSINDYIELNGKKYDKEQKEIIHMSIYAKKIKAGYMDSFMMLSAYLDNPNFF